MAPVSAPSFMKFLSRWLLLAGFALVVFSGKLWLVDRAGSDLPMWDQWDGESQGLLLPWVGHKLTAAHLFIPHNEHRIVLTRLTVLGLFELNDRQWDGRVEAVAAIAVHTLCAVALLLLGRRYLDRRWLVAFAALLVLLFALPASPDNTLVGFQLQFYLLMLFSLLHIWLTLRSDVFDGRWIAGQVCAVLTLGTMASGFLSSAAVLAVLGWRLLRERRWTGQQIAGAAIAAAIISVGLAIHHSVPGNELMHAQSPAILLGGIAKLLTWPVKRQWLPWTLVVCIPAACFLVRALRARRLSTTDAVALGLLAWTLLQFAALAYGRGSTSSTNILTNRYLDLATINLCLGLIFVRQEFAGRVRTLLAVAWIALIGGSLIRHSWIMWHYTIVPNIARDERRVGHVRDYLRTGDQAHLLTPGPGEIPYPSGPELVKRLKPTAVRAYLPAGVRTPLALSFTAPAPTVLPAALPPPPDALALSTWSANGDSASASWRTRPQPATTRPILRFYLAGDLGRNHPALQLAVKSAAGDVPIRPATAPGERWTAVEIARPAGPWWIEATDGDPAGWFAFTQPVEVARGSWLVARLTSAHFYVTALGVLCLAAGAAWSKRNESVA
jgi:hypothetical protein